jgi:hydroxyacyl-ACP dehydratase HTD2-like protein with hotdog domain
LLATLLAELLSHQLPQSRVRSFAVRAVSAQFVHEPFVVAGRPNEGNVDLWAANGANAVTMSAQVQLG